MSKKTFYRINWKEISFLLVIDFVIFTVFSYWSIANCSFPTNVIIVNEKILCVYQFFTDIQSMIVLFAIVLVINFILSGIWHFVVKK